MSKRGLPETLKMRHDWHYVEEITHSQRTFGRIVPIDKIEPNPDQPRVEIGDLSELTDSIRERGILEPLLVKPLVNNQRWLIIAGERRWRAAQLAGLSEVPCVEMNLDEAQIAEIALIENLQRKDLTVWEEADGLAALCLRYNYTHEDVAGKIGKSRSTVTESLTIAGIPPAVRQQCRTATITAKSVLLQIARQFDEAAMFEVLNELIGKKNSQAKQFAAAASRNADLNNEIGIAAGSAVGESAPQQADAARIPGSFPSSSTHKANFTDLSAPVRAYSYQPNQGNFKLALKFKKPADRNEIIRVLRDILSDLEETT